MRTDTDGKRAPPRLHNIFINVELIKILFKDLAENEKNAESAPRGVSELYMCSVVLTAQSKSIS